MSVLTLLEYDITTFDDATPCIFIINNFCKLIWCSQAKVT